MKTRVVPSATRTWMSNLSKETLTLIQGLDPAVYGFERPHCCPTAAPSIHTSWVPGQAHILIPTDVPPEAWDVKARNVPFLSALEARLIALQGDKKAKKAAPSGEGGPGAGVGAGLIRATAYYDPTAPASRHLVMQATESGCAVTEYTGVAPGEFAFESKSAVAADRSDRRYVFVCAHATRDARCAYCGPILVELIRKSIEKRYPGAPVEVYACSHIGGHVYAGNVLCYSRFGGRCFGCVTPQEVDALVDYIAPEALADVVPASLEPHLRGLLLQRPVRS